MGSTMAIGQTYTGGTIVANGIMRAWNNCYPSDATYGHVTVCEAHGHQRLRPLGGVQVVTTNFFPLFRFNRGTTVANRVLRGKGTMIAGLAASVPCPSPTRSSPAFPARTKARGLV